MAKFIRVASSYILDWIVVVCFAAAGAAFTYINGFHRPFSLTDTAISYPLKDNIVSLPVVAVISLVGPAAVIAIVNLAGLSISGSKTSRYETNLRFRDKVAAIAWETHAGWLGLCTGLAATLFVTAGLKDMVGKPRPDMLARCQPDLNNISQYIVGGLGMSLDSEAPPFVTSAICQQTDKRLLDDGFAAFPSGHASFNSAGMVYLTLWLCARWHIAIPVWDSFRSRGGKKPGARSSSDADIRSKAAPPLWQVAVAFVPIGVALFVSSSRYADFHHAGFDIIAGAFIGTVLGWAAFRLYHRPIRRSRGSMAWRPRDNHHAFLAYHTDDLFRPDEEHGQQHSNIELEHYGTKDLPRTATGSSHQPILGNAT